MLHGSEIRARYHDSREVSWLKPILFALSISGIGVIFGLMENSREDLIVVFLALCCTIVFQADQVSTVACIVVSIVFDWYEIISPPLRLPVIAVVMGLVILCTLAIRSHFRRSWVWPRMLWLWAVLLLIAIEPVLHGMDHSTYPSQSVTFYVTIFLGGFVFYSLGNIVAYDMPTVHRLFEYLSALATLLSLHTIIEATTGVFLLPSPSINDYLLQRSGFQFAYSSISRAGSLFRNPDWNGTFFAVMVFVALGLFCHRSSLSLKLIHGSQVALMLVALLFTYSTGAWAATLVGLIVFVVFVGRAYYRLLVPVMVAVLLTALTTLFSTQVAQFFIHATAPQESALRFGAWETAVNIIRAHPLNGVGLGLYTYLQQAEPFRVPAQYEPLAHPHNSYLELAASAGLPVALLFISAIGIALWHAIRIWIRSNTEYRPILGGGIAAICAISANSVTINAWTLAPLAAIAWLILGILSSPRLLRAIERPMYAERASSKIEESEDNGGLSTA